ncbi:hypothetical protein NOF55_10035 [Rhizobiaceae bacterium BDR2-2]|uniref:Uncharacterized protein n=1 Tax=Ectorhizobium quercum TaxID=2965071 RepID=A0AAE3SUT4_9HYPH|nr:hypothetical protein [Ectorhizobium quercum]MCX8997447.1 hypothetical protein [Ectorhizobium quercum]
MRDTMRSTTFRARGDTGVVYTVVQMRSLPGGKDEVEFALSDGRKVEKVGEEQFEIVATKELISRI